MISKTSVEALIEYAIGQTQWKQLPEGNDYTVGVEPEDRAPAEWWNALFGIITKNIGNASTDFDSVVAEITNVLSAADLTPNPAENNQLVVAIATLIMESSEEDIAYINEQITLVNKRIQERDKPIADTGGVLTFTSSGNIVLTNTATTRTLSAGGWVGQTATIFNSTANTITVTDGSNTFEIPTNRHFTYIWTGSRWQSKLVYIGQVLTWRPEDKDNASRGVVKGDYALDRTPWAITGTNTAEWEQIWTEGVYELSGVGDEVSEAVGGVYEPELANATGELTRGASTGFLFAGLANGIVTQGTQRTNIVNNLQSPGFDANINLSAGNPIYKDGSSNHPKHIRVRQYQYIGV